MPAELLSRFSLFQTFPQHEALVRRNISLKSSFTICFFLRLSTFITLVAACFIATDAAAIIDDRKHNCMIKHLKTLHMLESDFPNFTGGLPDNCNQIVEEFTEKSCQDVIKTKRVESMKTCVVSYLKRHKYPENVMKNSIIVSSLSISPKLKPFMSRKIQGEEHELVVKAVALCQIHKNFGDTFDNIMNTPHNSSAEDENPVPFYCARKHVIDNNEIDNKVYRINVNPKNLDTSTTHCTEFYELFTIVVKTSIEESIDKQIPKSEYLRACIRNKLFESRFIDELLVLEVLNEIKLTEAQKAAEKAKFLAAIDRVFESVLECV